MAFFDTDGNLPPQEIGEQNRFLAPESEEEVWKWIEREKVWTFPPDSGKYFRYWIKLDSSDNTTVNNWLKALPIAADLPIFIMMEGSVGICLPIALAIQFAENLFFAHDAIIFDPSLDWAIYYRHDDVFHFCHTLIYNAEDEKKKITQSKKMHVTIGNENGIQ